MAEYRCEFCGKMHTVTLVETREVEGLGVSHTYEHSVCVPQARKRFGADIVGPRSIEAAPGEDE